MSTAAGPEGIAVASYQFPGTTRANPRAAFAGDGINRALALERNSVARPDQDDEGHEDDEH